MAASAYFKGKKVTVMGLGLLGRGLGDTKYLAECGAEIIVTDLKPADALISSVADLKQFPNITFHLGEHLLEDFHDRDFILKAAGVPLDSPYIQEAVKAGIPIKMSASLFAEVAQIPVIGITGTRGKSSVTHMIEAIWRTAGRKVLLGGNVRGVSTLALLKEVEPENAGSVSKGVQEAEQVGIFELDSWQLQGFGDARMSPQLSVFTTFYRDHMNYYHENIDAYRNDKAQIFLYQHPEDTLVLGEQCAGLIEENYTGKIKGQVVIAGAENLPADWQLKIPGEHNRYNAALALAAARAAGIPDAVSREGLESFPGVPGRLQLVRTVRGVTLYNDTNSTTPEATLVALRALSGDEKSESEKKRVILIMGGADKGLSMDALLAEIAQSVKKVVLLQGTGTERIKNLLPEAQVFQNLAMAFEDAWVHAEPRDAILFSPAFASFGMFNNEYDRGDQFDELVKNLEA